MELILGVMGLGTTLTDLDYVALNGLVSATIVTIIIIIQRSSL